MQQNGNPIQRGFEIQPIDRARCTRAQKTEKILCQGKEARHLPSYRAMHRQKPAVTPVEKDKGSVQTQEIEQCNKNPLL